jgi:hypothetical protein
MNVSMNNYSRGVILLAAALISTDLAGCHSGEIAGSGSSCGPDVACRQFFTCVAGRCEADLDAGMIGDGSCTPSQPFGPAVAVEELSLSLSDDTGPRLTADELTVIFTSDRSGNFDIFTAARPDRKSAFSPPVPLAEVNSPLSESWASVTADGLKLFLEREHQIYLATRTTIFDSFSPPAYIDFSSFNPNAGQPFILPDESALFFVSGKLVTNDLYRAALMPDGRFAVPTLLSVDNLQSDEYMAVLTPDESTFYFGSNRADPGNRNDFDIWVAMRPAPGEPYGQPVSVAELNTPGEDLPGWVSSDGCRLYFSRAETVGRRIYVAERAH